MWEIILAWINPFNFIKKIFDFIGRPQLEIYYDSAETYHKAIDLSFGGNLGLFCHVMVRNKGRGTALNCIGELRSIKVFTNGDFQKLAGYKNIMQLKWAHEKDFSPKDIDTDMPRRLDVCYVHQGFDDVHFFTEKYPSGNQTDVSPGKYLIKIRIKSNNAKNVESYFIVSYKAGIFDSLKISNNP